MSTRSRRNVAIGSAVQAIVRLVVLLSGAFAVAIQVRTLTVSEYGIFVTIISLIALLSGLTDVGLTNTAVQRMARDRGRQSAIAGGLVIARGALGLLLGFAGGGISLILFSTSQERFAAALMIASLPVGMLTALQAIPIARLQLMQQNLLLATQGLLWVLVVIALGWMRAGLIMFAAGFLLCAVVQAALVWFLLGRQSQLDISSGMREIPGLLRQAIPLGLGGMGVTAYYRLSGIILFSSAGPTAAASYSAAFKVVDMLQAIPASLLAPLIPLLSQGFERGDSSRVIRVWDLASRIILSTSMMVAAGVFVTAPQIIAVLYGQAYSESVPLLRVVVIAFVPICIGWVSTGAITATGRVKGYTVVTLCAALLSVTCSIILMPRLGASAAVGITVGTEAIVALGLLWVLRRETKLGLPLSLWLRSAGAATLMALAVWAVRPPVEEWILLCIRVPIGLAVAAMALFALRVIRVSDLRAVLRKGDVEELST